MFTLREPADPNGRPVSVRIGDLVPLERPLERPLGALGLLWGSVVVLWGCLGGPLGSLGVTYAYLWCLRGLGVAPRWLSRCAGGSIGGSKGVFDS